MNKTIKAKIALTKLESMKKVTSPLPAVRMEFHISRKSRDKYEFKEEIYASCGNVVLADFHAVRVFAHKMNEKQDLSRYPEKAIRPSQLNAMGLIDEILHYVIYLYRQDENRNAFRNGLQALYNQVGNESVEKVLYLFTQEFPPVAVYKNELSLDDYINGTTEGVSNKELILEEMLMLWIANVNPAFRPYAELFDDKNLRRDTKYLKVMENLHQFFDNQPLFGPDHQNLIDMLRSPALAAPYSLRDQLEYIKEKWGMLLGKFLLRLMSSFDLIQEEDKMRGFGEPTNEVYDYSGYDFEYERFSADKDWMPKCVLIAKCTLVWLDQLSKEFGYPITRLDGVPDQELDKLAGYGFTGLWLIGIWERSRASKTIKHSCGNSDAESSAYSLFDYVVAYELGGQEALDNLKQRCWRRGIRLASDMVPNHTGIDSKWVHEHPDWFVQLNYAPFPSYSFNGQNLSTNPGLGVYIEDHYYTKSDAAVVFKRVDFGSGDTRYIYHGNDGTHMPWNDTAQLNFLNAEVREAVIQTICHVARMTPIIRFDAAMTLAKKHFQRLWFPVPGSGGDIPSRSEHGMSKYDFDQIFPLEFWREVVDRVASTVPDTLLLAEAFWLMEGYFVRTLGMHRVYNSAFMNMLKTEDNQKYRSTIKKTMEFDAEILKRFVNFMNNPDEDTAVAQFGKDDKYFGVCIMMVTMPGLPMFGHAQIEGFTEKYGMEYRRAYWNEVPDTGLIERHKREVFPLMKRRYLFAEVRNFLLYDFFAPEGWVNENVFAYSNSRGNEYGLVLYNNKFESARGWIKMSAAYAEKNPGNEAKTLVQKCLGEGLGLRNNPAYYCIFKDNITGLEYIRNNKEIWETGLYVELQAFKYHVFMEFKEVCDNEFSHYYHVYAALNGSGTPSIEEKLKELILEPIYKALYPLLNKQFYIDLFAGSGTKEKVKASGTPLELDHKLETLLSVVKNYYAAPSEIAAIQESLCRKLDVIQNLQKFCKAGSPEGDKKFEDVLKYLRGGMKGSLQEVMYILYSWLFVHQLGGVFNNGKGIIYSRSWIDEWMLGKKFQILFHDLKIAEDKIWDGIQLVKIMTSYSDWNQWKAPKKLQSFQMLKKILEDDAVRRFIQVNRYKDILWFNQEKLEKLCWWLMVCAVIELSKGHTVTELQTAVVESYQVIKKIKNAEKKSEFKIEKLLTILEGAKLTGTVKKG